MRPAPLVVSPVSLTARQVYTPVSVLRRSMSVQNTYSLYVPSVHSFPYHFYMGLNKIYVYAIACLILGSGIPRPTTNYTVVHFHEVVQDSRS